MPPTLSSREMAVDFLEMAADSLERACRRLIIANDSSMQEVADMRSRALELARLVKAKDGDPDGQ